MRKGYDVRTSEWGFLRKFADFVSDNADRFNALLDNGERVCGEWMIKTHSLFYNLPHEPFIVFDIIKSDKKQTRPNYEELIRRCKEYNFTTTWLIWSGASIPVQDALGMLGKGFHGCQSVPEGIVYRYERDGRFETSAKFVANLNVTGDYMNDEIAVNTWKGWR